MGLDEVQAAYEVALGRLLSDLAVVTGTTPEVRVDFTEPSEGLPLPYAFVDPTDGGSHETTLALFEDVEAATVALAQPFQVDVLEMLWGSVWPECPGHPHPAEPVGLDGLAVWRCPTSQAIVARIGSLGK